VVIATVLRSNGGTGVQTHFVELERYLSSRHLPYSMVTPFSSGGVVRDLVFGVRRLLEPWSGAANVAWYRHWHGLFLERALKRKLRSTDDAVVYCQCPLAARAALRARRSAQQRVVMAVHFCVSQADEWAEKGQLTRGGRLFRSIRLLERDVLARVDGIVFVSESARKDLWLDDLADVPTATIPNFLGTAGPGLIPGPRADLVSVGSLEPRKNHRFLLDTLAAAKQRGRCYTLDILGGGPERRSLLRHARYLGIESQVRLLGYVPEAGRLLSGYRAYLHPAKREPFGLAIVEAMAAGVPVIAAPVGGIPQLIDESVEGMFWDLADPDQAAGVLIDLMDDEVARARMGAAARRRFLGQFDAAVVCPSLYEFLMSPSAPSVRSPLVPKCPTGPVA
jgi:glycosyltransferase involved in cell wall biosynthesis